MNTERRYDIDWLRVIAIGLLLIYHIAIIFQPWAMFIGFMRSDELMEGLWVPMTMLNVWRIPLLFYVSGMGVYFAMQKRSVKQLLFDRGKRILLPYVFGIIAIVPLHFLIFQHYYGQPLQYFPHPSHLWFLGNLVIYISILFAFFHHMLQRPESKLRRLLQQVMANPLGPLTVSIFFIAEVLVVQPQEFAMYAQTLHGFINGFFAFFFGFLFLWLGNSFWATMLKWRWLYAGLAAAMYTIRLVVFESNAPNALMAIESNLWIFCLFGFAYKNLNKPSALLSWLSQAVYPIYIIHMVVLYGAASLILPLDIPVLAKFIAIVLFTAIVCLGIYEFIIKRIRLLRPLFGMIIKQKEAVSPRSQPS